MATTQTSRSFSITPHPVHPRIRHFDLEPAATRAFLAAIEATSVQELEYVPFARFVLADRLERSFPGILHEIRTIISSRALGGLTASFGAATTSADDYVRISTAFAYALGAANFDSMSGSYYARFQVRHTDESDSYLRQAYHTMTLHTDGTYVDERTDYLLMMKFGEQNARGGESRLIHLDDWEARDVFTARPAAVKPMVYASPPSKNVSQTVTHPAFAQTPDGWTISFIDQFAKPETIDDALFLATMLDSLERSPGTREVPLPAGDLIMLNNAFWMHGRAAFEPDVALFRELLRIRGAFAP
jgi:protein CsiD